MNIFEKAVYAVSQFLDRIDDTARYAFQKTDYWVQLNLGDPSLEQTLTEKNGQGPHGYGDPRDASLREEEYFLFPRMIWKKIRHEKCSDVTDKYYACIFRQQNGENVDCKKEENDMMTCRSNHYHPDAIDSVEKECIIDYLQLRSKFRETGSEDDLWKIKMLMLHPSYNRVYEAYKKGASAEELKNLIPVELKRNSEI